jgi:hypothetical protein
MTSTVQRRIAAISGLLLFSLAVLVLLVSTAQAAQPLTQLQRAHGGAKVTYAPAPLTQLQRAHGGAAVTYAAARPARRSTGVGRGRSFVTVSPVRASTAGIIGGFAVTAFVIAFVAFLALGSRASRRGELAPVTSLVQAPSESPATRYEDRERRAA